MKALPVLSFVVGALAFCSSAEAKTLQHGIASCYGPGFHGRRTANGEKCQRLVTVVRELVADPQRAIETSSDTDEDKAEALDKTRRPKTAALKNPAQ